MTDRPRVVFLFAAADVGQPWSGGNFEFPLAPPPAEYTSCSECDSWQPCTDNSPVAAG
jgi:hypothetical protein